MSDLERIKSLLLNDEEFLDKLAEAIWSRATVFETTSVESAKGCGCTNGTVCSLCYELGKRFGNDGEILWV